MGHIKNFTAFINEELSNFPTELWYQKCEGGDGKIDPESFKFLEEKDKKGNLVIEFIKDPDPGYDSGQSASINNCLGGDPNATLMGRRFNILNYPPRFYATYELNKDNIEL